MTAVNHVADLIDQPLPDLELDSSQGDRFRLRRDVGVSPLVLFFYVKNGTPT